MNDDTFRANLLNIGKYNVNLAKRHKEEAKDNDYVIFKFLITCVLWLFEITNLVLKMERGRGLLITLFPNQIYSSQIAGFFQIHL